MRTYLTVLFVEDIRERQAKGKNNKNQYPGYTHRKWLLGVSKERLEVLSL